MIPLFLTLVVDAGVRSSSYRRDSLGVYLRSYSVSASAFRDVFQSSCAQCFASVSQTGGYVVFVSCSGGAP